MTDEELRKLVEEARQASVRPALWEPYRLYNALADGIEGLLDRVEKAEAELGRYDRRLVRTENEYNRLETSHSILERAIQRVRELHAKHENTIHTRPEWVCAHRHCVDDSMDQNAWPCPTIRALEGDE